MTRFSEIDRLTMDFLLQTVPQSPAYLQPRHDLHDVAVACFAELKDELKIRNSGVRTIPIAKEEPVVVTTTEDLIANESTSEMEEVDHPTADRPRRK